LRLGFDRDNFAGGAGEFAEETGKVTDVGADIEKISAGRFGIGVEEIFGEAGFVKTATIEAAANGVAFVTLHAQAERQIARGDGVAERIGTLGPVGETADFVAQTLVHRVKYNVRDLWVECKPNEEGLPLSQKDTEEEPERCEEYWRLSYYPAMELGSRRIGYLPDEAAYK